LRVIRPVHERGLDRELVVEGVSLVPGGVEGVAERLLRPVDVPVELDRGSRIDRGAGAVEHPLAGAEDPRRGLVLAPGRGDAADVDHAIRKRVRVPAVTRELERLAAERERTLEIARTRLDAAEVRQLGDDELILADAARQREALLEAAAGGVVVPLHVVDVGEEVELPRERSLVAALAPDRDRRLRVTARLVERPAPERDAGETAVGARFRLPIARRAPELEDFAVAGLGGVGVAGSEGARPRS